MNDSEAKLRELAEKATLGPWTVERVEYPAGQDVSFEVQSGRDCQPVVQTYMREYRTEQDRISADAANAEFIAECRTAVPALLALLEAERRAKKELAETFFAEQARASRAEQALKDAEKLPKWKNPRQALYELCMQFRVATSQTKVNQAFEQIKEYVVFAEARASRAEQALKEAETELANRIHLELAATERARQFESALAGERERVTKLEAALRYVLETRDVKCQHKHPGPDDICAKCIADRALAVPDQEAKA